MGEPNSDELDAARGGRWQAFGVDTNRIYWHPNVAGGKANQVGGLILQKWLTNGDERGALGYPLISESPAQGGRYNHFEGGSIYWKNGAAAVYIVRGAIRDYWAQADWENGTYGFPVSDEYDFGGGRRQDFERGSLYWNVHSIDAESGPQQLPASSVPQRINPSDSTTDPTAMDDIGPRPRPEHAIENFTGLVGIALKNAGGLSWSHTDAVLDARCDSAAIRTGCVNPTAKTAVVYDPVKNPAIKEVSQHVFDAQASLPSHWATRSTTT